MGKIEMNTGVSVEETFQDFIISRRSRGLADKTLQSYQSHFQAIARHLNISLDIESLTKRDLDNMVSSMRDAGLATNSISSYTRVFKAFLSWCNEEGITRLNIKTYRKEETVKDTYTDRELAILLKKPDIRKCGFGEYRIWVVINFLMNCGCRAAEDDPLFCTENGLPLTENSLRKAVNYPSS